VRLGTARFEGRTTALLVEGDHGHRVDGLPGRADVVDVLGLIQEPLLDSEVDDLRRSDPVSLAGVTWCAPLLRTPKNIFCVGVNYAEHLAESRTMRPSAAATTGPCWFTKPWTSLAGNDVSVMLAPEQDQVDFEGEVAAVIGRHCSGLSPDRALDAVFGWTILNDVSDRALQRDREQWFLGKGADGHAPCGPWVVTADEIGDPQKLELRTEVNGEVRQSASTALMIHSFAELIADLSRVLTLEPGDIIAGGTPSGVGMRDGRYLRPGDDVVVTVQGIGELRTPVRGTR
jgi:2-keto-4-pentenoate hydratase/2-oxohepta-3-ene-1,7-dioic acid hydratase in catechol pathway